MEFQSISALFNDILTVSEQGLIQTIKISHKRKFSKIIVYCRFAMSSLDLMKCTNKLSERSAGYHILLNTARANSVEEVKQILRISNIALRSLRQKSSNRNKNNRWRYGAIKDRAERIIQELMRFPS